MKRVPQDASHFQEDDEVYRFILEEIDSVPHLEALLQLWNSSGREWSEQEIASRLFVPTAQARSILQDLTRRRLIQETQRDSGLYIYSSSPGNDPRMKALATAYRKDLISISNMIHAKASSGVLEFARAFELTRKRKPK